LVPLPVLDLLLRRLSEHLRALERLPALALPLSLRLVHLLEQEPRVALV
jgi:hypothetical protein